MAESDSPAKNKSESGAKQRITPVIAEPGKEAPERMNANASPQQAALPGVPDDPTAGLAFRAGNTRSQAAALHRAGLPEVQRQKTASQIGRVQGNRHLQRLLDPSPNAVQRWPWDETRPDRQLIDDAIRTRSVSDAKAIRNVSVASGPERIQLIDILSHQGWVGPDDETQIERLWNSFGRGLAQVWETESNRTLWNHCIEAGAELESISAVQSLRALFRRDVTFTAAGYLAGNRTIVGQEMRRMGVAREEGQADAPITAGQEQQIRDMQQAARMVAQLQRAQEDLHRVQVGTEPDHSDTDSPRPIYSPVYFDPLHPPQIPAPAGHLTMRPWDTVKTEYDRATAVIGGLTDMFPALYAISREGRSAQTQQFADAANPAAARAQLSPAMRSLDAHIANAQRMNRDGAINPLDLLPIHEQLLSGQVQGTQGVNWNSALPRWAAGQEKASHEAQQFWTHLGLQSLSAAAFLLAPFTGGASMFVTLVALGAAGASAVMSTERYQSLAAAARTEVRAGTALVTPAQVTLAEQQMQADQIGFAVAAILIGVGLAARGAVAISRALGGRSASLRALMGEARFAEYEQAIKALKAEHPQLQNIPTEELIALRGYTAEDYAQLNAALRSGDPALLAQVQVQIRAASSGLRSLPVYQGQVRRIVSMTPDMAAPYRQVGNVITEQAFISSSMAGGTYQRGGNLVIHITSRTGRDVSLIARHLTEREVLFMPGTRFQVTSVEMNGFVVRMVEVP